MSSLDYLDLCRLCLVKDRVSVPIFEDEGDVRQIFLKITACLPVKVGRDDKLPKKICDDCVYKVELFYQFWNTTANAEKQLLQWLGEVGGLEEKQGYVTDILNQNVMKQERNSENRLEGSLMQVSGHPNNMDINMMDENMTLSIPMMIPTGNQQISVPMDSVGNTVQAVPGPSTQASLDQVSQSQVAVSSRQDEEDETSDEDDNTDDDCDNEGLPVKEESEDDPNSSRNLEPATFVNVSLCDEAGPSGLQQQKISEMSEIAIPQTSDGDPKTEFPKDYGVFIYGNKSVEVRPWNVIELDSIRYYAFLPKNMHSHAMKPKMEVEDEEYSDMIFTELTVANEIDNVNKSLQSDFIGYSTETSGAENLTEKESFLCANSITHTSESTNLIKDSRLVDTNIEIEPIERIKASESAILVKNCIESQSKNCISGDNGFEFRTETEYFEPDNSFENSDSNISCVTNDSIPDTKKKQSNVIKHLFGCQPCNIFFPTKDLLQRHTQICKSSVIRKNKNTKILKSIVLSCSKCDFMTWNRSTLHSHVKRKHARVQFVEIICDLCGFKCHNKRQLKEHFDRKHVEESRFECEFCGRKFKVKGDMKLHERFVHKENPVICDICGKTCNNSSALYMHQKNKHFLPEFICHICKRRMVSQTNLDEHIERQHIKYTAVTCNICGKSFTRKSRLSDHMRIHTGDKPHECPICNKAFNRKTMLRQHLLIHSGVRPYECDICGKAFTQKPGLISHRKSHPGEHPPLPVIRIDHIINPIIQG